MAARRARERGGIWKRNDVWHEGEDKDEAESASFCSSGYTQFLYFFEFKNDILKVWKI